MVPKQAQVCHTPTPVPFLDPILDREGSG